MEKREAILEVATQMFSEKGVTETSVADISRGSGVATGTVFYHFNSKEELFLAILEHMKCGILEEFEIYSREVAAANGLQMTENAVLFYFHLADKREEWFRLLHRHYPIQLVEENPLCRGYLEAIYNCILDIFETSVLRGQDDGSIRPVVARKAALILFSMIDGVVRLKTLDLYDTSALCRETVEACRAMLTLGAA